MDFYDLMAFCPEGTVPACYVCNTTIGVAVQEVVTQTEPELKFETLPVCRGCSNAVGRVIELEDRIADLEERVRQGAGLWDIPVEIIEVFCYAEA